MFFSLLFTIFVQINELVQAILHQKDMNSAADFKLDIY